MKKLVAILFASLLVTGFVACGQSEEEKKQDSLTQDSVEREAEATADMLIQQMERENDSINRADSIARAKAAADSAAANAPKQ